MNCTILKILLFALICLISYLVAEILYERGTSCKIKNILKTRNDKYYEKIAKHFSNSSNIDIKEKFNIPCRIALQIEKAGLKDNYIITPLFILLLSFACFVVAFMITIKVFKIVGLSIIISLPAFIIPMLILKLIENKSNSMVEEAMLDFLLQLKNYTKINNDIIFAFKQIKTSEPLQSYINQFLVEIHSGIKFEKAIINFKSKVKFEKLKEVLSNIEYCYIYGGDFSELMEKSYRIISKVQEEKRARNQETQSARIILAILIALDIFVYFDFIGSNSENYEIMTNSIVGNFILYWNFISIWLLALLMKNVKKLDY